MELTYAAAHALITMRNPFGVQDVTGPDDREVQEFAAQAPSEPMADDPNAAAWSNGEWSSRWNGGAAGARWQQGRAQIELHAERFYALFDWDGGTQRGLIEARPQGRGRLVGRYVNLGNPSITRPWIGLIVGEERIDGYWTQGRLDFRR
jgi:hypothetical protein